jgi:glucose-1-phosphate thymidylyltransferase
MKGIILAGGSGTRLYPITKGISKQLTPVYDKPMIYYPLSVLMLTGIKEILIITTPHDLPQFKTVLGDGSNLGVNFTYAEQQSPDGLAQAFIIGEEFIGDDDVCLILGDAEFDNLGNVVSLEEKPKVPKSNYAVVGLYFYPNSVINIAKNVKPSERGEYEITSINQVYLEQKSLVVELMRRGYAWLDTGTHESLLEASNFIHIIERRQGLKVSCIEEIAYTMGYISKSQLIALAQPLKKNQYGQYLIARANENN